MSVITVTYNNYNDLHRTLASLEKVNGIESVVVNGGDCDQTKKLLSNFDGIAISEPDKGISDAFNKGVTMATGDNVMFLNSGDVLLSLDYLLEAEKTLSFNPEISFVHSDLLYDDRIGGDIRLTALQPFFFSTPPLGRGMPYHHQSMIVRKNVFDKTGLFNLQYKISMDFDWVCRLHKHRLKGFYWNKEPVVKMDGGGISAVKEHLVIWESLRALRDNQLLTLKNLYGISVRTFFYLARQTMETFGMSEILGALKKKKHNLLWQRSRAQAIKQNYSEVKTRPEHIFPTTAPPNWAFSPQKRIGLNGLLIHDYPTGLSRYSYELIRRIMTQWKGDTVAYSTSQELKEEFPESPSFPLSRKF
ncbi:MAG TPA: glycosyltransferase [Candidatus Lambdaproteobacteria bacterium]|nr:glycosyltransferase [Candidatus Lambdaproteobacteria bacterium]